MAFTFSDDKRSWIYFNFIYQFWLLFFIVSFYFLPDLAYVLELQSKVSNAGFFSLVLSVPGLFFGFLAQFTTKLTTSKIPLFDKWLRSGVERNLHFTKFSCVYLDLKKKKKSESRLKTSSKLNILTIKEERQMA